MSTYFLQVSSTVVPYPPNTQEQLSELLRYPAWNNFTSPVMAAQVPMLIEDFELGVKVVDVYFMNGNRPVGIDKAGAVALSENGRYCIFVVGATTKECQDTAKLVKRHLYLLKLKIRLSRGWRYLCALVS